MGYEPGNGISTHQITHGTGNPVPDHVLENSRRGTATAPGAIHGTSLGQLAGWAKIRFTMV